MFEQPTDYDDEPDAWIALGEAIAPVIDALADAIRDGGVQ